MLGFIRRAQTAVDSCILIMFQCPAPIAQSLHVTIKVVEAVKKSSQYKIATVTFNFIIKTSTTWTKLKQILWVKQFM